MYNGVGVGIILGNMGIFVLWIVGFFIFDVVDG